ncbi:cholinergic receptor nicotinic beta 3 subunit, transcript variant X2 [Ictidomys tridecemlineatus]|uniref:neuronal acetylcholine receptor subunit beta-3 isoform X2 n=1 Tax=Ictidomys tridecemlineatus TaxID=43179 RepID=UPI000B53B930|nr:neuronal acetylcholine receptor subunit beta-3 isoform X2 [Ictidomys tridecemlineatus]KAG3294735.1 cholinergic receptor nicotinic beta 3 subunit, transcript variant X2 [Ictidomys tridecemlineatus]
MMLTDFLPVPFILSITLSAAAEFSSIAENEDALLRHLFQGYQKWVRPVLNSNDTIKVYFGLKISQLVDVDEKNQLMTTNVWLKQEWTDHKLRWNPDEYGGIHSIKVPSESLWLPDIVLFEKSSSTYHPMAPWVKRLFLQKLPKLLCMKDHVDRYSFPDKDESKPVVKGKALEKKKQKQLSNGEKVLVAFLEKAAESIRYISRHVKKEHFISQVVQDWKFVAQVLDRIFLWLFLIVSVTGSVLIFTPALKMWLHSYH